MTGSETMTKRRRRSFSPEFTAEIVELCRQPGGSPGSVSAELDLTETAVRRWVTQTDVDAGAHPGMSSTKRDELAPAAPGEPDVARGARHLEAGSGFFARETR